MTPSPCAVHSLFCHSLARCTIPSVGTFDVVPYNHHGISRYIGRGMAGTDLTSLMINTSLSLSSSLNSEMRCTTCPEILAMFISFFSQMSLGDTAHGFLRIRKLRMNCFLILPSASLPVSRVSSPGERSKLKQNLMILSDLQNVQKSSGDTRLRLFEAVWAPACQVSCPLTSLISYHVSLHRQHLIRISSHLISSYGLRPQAIHTCP